ncbi:MAG: hypothetical protein N3C57_04345 [Aquificaceae bacterium]|nr:hypothetical protein [Aquificaceae bacterium]
MPTLSYELTLPQNTYPALDRLFSLFRNLTNSFLDRLWNSQSMDRLSEKGSACGILKGVIPKPDGVPSRLYRNALEMAGQIVRSKIDRRRLFEYFSQDLSRIEKPEREVATKLCYSQGFVLNVKR